MREHKPSMKADQFLWIQIYGIVPSPFPAIKKYFLKHRTTDLGETLVGKTEKDKSAIFVLLMKKIQKQYNTKNSLRTVFY